MPDHFNMCSGFYLPAKHHCPHVDIDATAATWAGHSIDMNDEYGFDHYKSGTREKRTARSPLKRFSIQHKDSHRNVLHSHSHCCRAFAFGIVALHSYATSTCTLGCRIG